MKKVALALSIAMLFSLITNSSSAVEFGQDATGDPNAVKVGGASGFLYSDRIVFTAAHVIESTGGLEYWEKEGVIYSPGIASTVGAKTYKAKKIIMSPTYIPRNTNNQTRIDDFAIIVLQESIPIQNSVVVATKENVDSFIANKTTVLMVGYGLQNPSQREINKVFDFSPRKLTTRMVGEEEILQYRSNNLQKTQATQTVLKYGMLNSKENGSNCDGDSGSGYFVEKEGIRFYIGPTGGFQWGITNCYRDNTFGIGGGMTGITPTFKFIDLVKQAETIVAEDKQKEFIKAEEIRIAAEAKAKQEAEAKAKAEAEAEAKAKAEAEAEAKAKYESVLNQYQALLERIRLLKIKYPQETTLGGIEAKVMNLPIIRGSDLSTAIVNINGVNSKLDYSEKVWAKTQKTTITCVKGKLSKKVTGINPKCPAGYKKK